MKKAIKLAKGLPGRELPDHKPYGFEEHARQFGLGVNRLRTARFAQPRALKAGDIFATGDRVLSSPREGGNGSILIHLTGGSEGYWVDIPARIPIALLTKDEVASEMPATVICQVNGSRCNICGGVFPDSESVCVNRHQIGQRYKKK